MLQLEKTLSPLTPLSDAALFAGNLEGLQTQKKTKEKKKENKRREMMIDNALFIHN